MKKVVPFTKACERSLFGSKAVGLGDATRQGLPVPPGVALSGDLVEALASGTPVVSTDNPGGVELNGVFGADVTIVPREQPIALGKAITHFLQNKRRTFPGTRETIEREFRPSAVANQYWSIYESLR